MRWNKARYAPAKDFIIAGICAFAFALFVFGAPAAHAKPNAAITVNTLVDTVATDGVCSLREAIQSANAGMPVGNCASGVIGPDTITITATGTIALGSALPDIIQDVDIVGPGAGLLTVSGSNAYRVFKVNSGIKVNLSGVTVANGFVFSSNGAGLLNAGTMTMTNVFFFNNLTDGGWGGGINNDGKLSIINSDIYSNSIVTAGDGGGINNYGTLTVTNTNVFSNVVTGSLVNGGGIANSVTATMSIVNSALYNNTVPTGGGGAIYVNSTSAIPVMISNTVLYSNTAKGAGGIFINFGSMQIISTTIRDNTAGSASCTGSCRGGGIANHGSVTITNSTISGNKAIGDVVSGAGDGGGLHVGGMTMLDNVTVSGNTATNGGGGIGTQPGGTINLNNATITKNTAESGGGIQVIGGTLNFKNTVIAGNIGTVQWSDCSNTGTVNSQDYNFIGDPTGCTISGTTVHNQSGDPKLAPLASWGGPTKTHALLPGSPALNNGNPATCLSTDQRGILRPVGPACDIGAFEGVLLQIFLPFVAR